MAGNRVEIEQMLLRVPGLTRQEAVQLGQDVARLLAARLPPEARPVRLGALNLRLTLPPGTPKSRLPDLVVDAILGRIG